MLTGRFPEAGEQDPETLLSAYQDVLATAAEETGTETILAETDLDEETVTAVVEGDAADVTLEATAAVLGASPEFPDAEGVVAEARDILLLGMTTAVMDVDAVAAELGGDLDPKVIQQKVEGRHPITLGEYARIHHVVESQS